MLETTDTLLKGLAEGNQNRWSRFYRDYVPWIERTLTQRVPRGRRGNRA